MFDWLYSALGSLLYWFSVAMGNSYVLALILYALVFKVVFLPFAIKQQKNQVKMANLTPKIELIKAKYRGRTDRVTMQKMQQEIMELQQREGASPLGGCLPMLIQLPIIIFLYNVIRSPLTYICRYNYDDGSMHLLNKKAVELGLAQSETAFSKLDEITRIGMLQEAGFSGFGAADGYESLRALPDISLFGVNVGSSPNAVFDGGALWVIIFSPILAAALQWLSMFLTRRWNGNANQLATPDGQTAASMKIMDLVFPLMTLFIAFSFSALMGLYWIFQSVLGILQTFILSRVMPMPHFTEEQLKQMRKEQKAQEKAQKALLKGQEKYRSLHYIDEDDYDELPTVKASEPKKQAPKLGPTDLPDIKD